MKIVEFTDHDKLSSIFESLDSDIDIKWSKTQSEWQGVFNLNSEEYLIKISRFSKDDIEEQTSIKSSDLLDFFNDNSVWGFKFYRRDNPKLPFRLFSQNPSRYPIEVFGIVTNNLIKFLDEQNPEAVIYSSYEERRDLYSKLGDVIVKRRPDSYGLMDHSSNKELKVKDEFFFILGHRDISNELSEFILNLISSGSISK